MEDFSHWLWVKLMIQIAFRLTYGNEWRVNGKRTCSVIRTNWIWFGQYLFIRQCDPDWGRMIDKFVRFPLGTSYGDLMAEFEVRVTFKFSPFSLARKRNDSVDVKLSPLQGSLKLRRANFSIGATRWQWFDTLRTFLVSIVSFRPSNPVRLKTKYIRGNKSRVQPIK